MNETITAHHEAAHAIVLYRTAGHAGCAVSIVSSEDKLGCAVDGISDIFSIEDNEAHVLSCYAGGHAQRLVDPAVGDEGCWSDDDGAGHTLAKLGCADREQEFRDRSLNLVQRHWVEIRAVAEELIRVRVLRMDEIEIIADAAAGDAEADLELYRRVFSEQLDAWRLREIQEQT